MCAYPTKNFQTRYPKHTYFFYLALSHSQAAKAEISLGLLPVSPVFAWACSQSPQSPPSLTRAFAWACSQSHQSLCLGLLPVSPEPLPGLAPSLTRAFAWACSQSYQSLCLGLLPVLPEPLPGLAPSLTRAFAWACSQSHQSLCLGLLTWTKNWTKSG